MIFNLEAGAVNYVDEPEDRTPKKYYIYSPAGKMIAKMMSETLQRAIWYSEYKYGPGVRVESE